jgi:hypothetical protein
MKLKRSLLATTLIFPLFFVTFLSFSTSTVTAQDTTKIALQRGYRTGYSDGYMAGYRDAIENSSRSFDKHREYTKADRAYVKEYGSLEDYKDGYQQGFEGGYATGYEKRSFNAALPGDLKRRGVYSGNPQTQPEINNNKPPTINPKPETQSSPESGEPIILIPTDTELVIELINDLNTDLNKEGDKFTARIVSPNEINGAIIEGKVTKIQKPGRIKRRSEMSLSFDRILLSDTRWSNFSANLLQVLPIKGDNISKVDVEGTVEGQSSIKSDAIKVGVATGTGLVVGGVVGGPVGAAVGAGVGAAFGVGAVVVERGKHVKLTKGQQLRIKTAYETQIR